MQKICVIIDDGSQDSSSTPVSPEIEEKLNLKRSISVPASNGDDSSSKYLNEI